ncbi:MAG: 4Fe-4S binding protein [Thermanaeromonas sp.]|uniref:4Fe-4S binding protein n=1 Tax=Thermanaeromonas sp. TaxID=2003697 RepID=UPI002439C266|nr:4Fe-4S binding protein [Thermanaeromonas sp.]MCG0277733.1 4Fe-4S binding protein [Thermanaeromonas sp.]
MRSPEELKAGGLIPQRQKRMVTIRCMAPGGRLTSQRLRAIADVADKYGRGIVHLSVRMSPEILYVKLEDVEAVTRELAAAGQRLASCGKRVRVPTACGGCEYNPNGLVDTQRLAQEVNERYFGWDLPHKFKISFSGCPTDCMRSRENDLGFQGEVEPALDPNKCNGCGLCVEVCQEGALYLKDNLPWRDPGRCLGCGDCLHSCPTDALTVGRCGHAVYVGGKHGRHPHVAYPIASLVPDELIFPVIETVIHWYREHGQPGERIGDTIDRVGINILRRALKPVIGQYLLSHVDLEKPRWQSVFYRGVAATFPAYED